MLIMLTKSYPLSHISHSYPFCIQFLVYSTIIRNNHNTCYTSHPFFIWRVLRNIPFCVIFQHFACMSTSPTTALPRPEHMHYPGILQHYIPLLSPEMSTLSLPFHFALIAFWLVPLFKSQITSKNRTTFEKQSPVYHYSFEIHMHVYTCLHLITSLHSTVAYKWETTCPLFLLCSVGGVKSPPCLMCKILPSVKVL